MSDDQKSPKLEPSSSPSATAAQIEEARTVMSAGQKSPKLELTSSSSTTAKNGEAHSAESGDQKFNVESSSLKRGLNDDVADVRKRCKGNILHKIEYSEPYRLFLSSIVDEENTHDEMLTVSFPELLDDKLGLLESSLHITFKVEIEWLLAQYAVNNENSTPITLLYGWEDPNLPSVYRLENDPPQNVNVKYVKPNKLFGHHHIKMMILSYTDGSIRVVVTTGNLIEKDWKNTIQGIWISPRLPRIENGPTGAGVGDSETHFKKDLLEYLEAYKLPTVEPWIQKVANADCTEVKVFFIASIPGTHEKDAPVNWGLTRMTQLLSEHATILNEDAENSSLYYQCSSIGSLGKNPSDWLLGQFTRTMKSSSCNSVVTPEVKVIYPCYEDVVSSFDGSEAGRCLPYSKTDHFNQLWLKNYLCKWRSNSRHRTRAMPHIKTYCRLTPCKKYLSWFLLTSHNLTKAAWGKENKKGTNIQIFNYEGGILFMPQYLISKTRLPLTNQSPSEDGPRFHLPYDIPLENYRAEDEPWTHNHLIGRQSLT